jgi:hypothetical protein
VYGVSWNSRRIFVPFETFMGARNGACTPLYKCSFAHLKPALHASALD